MSVGAQYSYTSFAGDSQPNDTFEQAWDPQRFLQDGPGDLDERRAVSMPPDNRVCPWSWPVQLLPCTTTTAKRGKALE